MPAHDFTVRQHVGVPRPQLCDICESDPETNPCSCYINTVKPVCVFVVGSRVCEVFTSSTLWVFPVPTGLFTDVARGDSHRVNYTAEDKRTHTRCSTLLLFLISIRRASQSSQLSQMKRSWKKHNWPGTVWSMFVNVDKSLPQLITSRIYGLEKAMKWEFALLTGSFLQDFQPNVE